MPRKLFSVWGGLPDFCALAAIVWCLSYAITLAIVGSHIGRQSSTFAIGIGLPIFAAPLLGAVGLVVGRVIAFTLGRTVPPRWIPVLKWSAPLVLLVIGVVASRQASVPLHAAERAARPEVIQNTARIDRRTGSYAADEMKHGARVYDQLNKVNQAIRWGTGSVNLVSHDDVLEVRFEPAGTALTIPLTGIDYINLVDAIPLQLGAGARPALALLITGRATGRRDLLAVISGAGELVYLERLERFWNPGLRSTTVPLAIAHSAQGDLILVGSEPQQLLILGPQDSG